MSEATLVSHVHGLSSHWLLPPSSPALHPYNASVTVELKLCHYLFSSQCGVVTHNVQIAHPYVIILWSAL
jgi:hypothetical protein